MQKSECTRNCWIVAAIIGLVVVLFASGAGDLHWLAGLFVGAITCALFGGFLRWFLCDGQQASYDPNIGLTQPPVAASVAAPVQSAAVAASPVVEETRVKDDNVPEAPKEVAKPAPVVAAQVEDAPKAAAPVAKNEPEPAPQAQAPVPVAAQPAADEAKDVVPAPEAEAPVKNAEAEVAAEIAAPVEAAPAEDHQKKAKRAEDAMRVVAGPDEKATRPKKAKDDGAKKDKKSKEKSKTKAPKGDDLKVLIGIGPKIERMLNKAGVTRFEQIAAWDADDIERMSDVIGRFGPRILSEDWVGQARKLAEGKDV